MLLRKVILFRLSVLLGLALAFSDLDCRGQWQTQSIGLKSGWNAVFLHVDASHASIDSLVGDDGSSPILEIWRWNTPGPGQFIDDPSSPNDRGSEWSTWVRTDSPSSLRRLVGDSAYLVRVADNVSNYVWNLKGRPVAPRSRWSITGLNLIGFSSVEVGAPSFDTFLATAPELNSFNTEIFQYNGGPLGPDNPSRVAALRSVNVDRGKAFWVRSGDVFNRYFGPFEIRSSGSGSVNFHEKLSTYSLRLKNLSAGPVTVSVELIPSESAPSGQEEIAAVPPLLVRGAFDISNLTYSYSNLPAGSTVNWTLPGRDQEGSETEVVFGLDRASMTHAPGELLAGVLRFTDSLGHSQVDMPVSARVADESGLWVGGAVVMQVGQYLKSYERGAVDPIVYDNAGLTITNDLVLDDGRYVITGIDTNLTSVPSPYPLRLIVHNNSSSGSAKLFQRMFLGVDADTNAIIANQESMLNRDYLEDSRRISAAHLPWSRSNEGWEFNGPLGRGGIVTASITNSFDNQVSNPFVHLYHPDHDNKEARFGNELTQGSESYTIVRDITLRMNPPSDDFASLTSGLSLTGDYFETIRVMGLNRGGGTFDTREFVVQGVFDINRVSDIPDVTTP